jgi:hypothetical protein
MVLLRSVVLRAMLTANMRERNTGRIELPDMNLKTGRGLIFFLYNGRLEEEEDTDLRELLAVADKYDIQVGLKGLSHQFEIG